MWKRILIGLTIGFLGMVLVLAAHIYVVTHPKEGQIPTLTLTKIEFQEPLGQERATLIRERMLQWEGVRDLRLNLAQAHLVCLHDLSVLSAEDLVSKINFHFKDSAALFRPDARSLSKSCPAIDRNSLTYRFGAFLQKTFE